MDRGKRGNDALGGREGVGGGRGCWIMLIFAPQLQHEALHVPFGLFLLLRVCAVTYCGIKAGGERMAPNPQNKVSRFLLVTDLVWSYEFYIEIIGEVYVINNV